jgi:hypothetical protein
MRDRYGTNQRRARRAKAIVHAPDLGAGPEAWLKHFAGSVDLFPELSAAARIELAWRLTKATWDVPLNAKTLDLSKKERKAVNMSPPVALNCRDGEQMSRQLSGVKRTRHGPSRAAVIDPKRTLGSRSMTCA